MEQFQKNRLVDTKITAETKYFTNVTGSRNETDLILHYKESNSFFVANGAKINQFKAKDSEIKPHLFFLFKV